MASSININQNNNDITLQDNNRSISITDNNAGTTVNVTQPVTNVVTVATPGPQGPVGPIPVSGSFTGSFSGSFIGNLTGTASNATSASYALTASYLEGYISPFPYSGSAVITGSLTVSGSSTLTNIGPAIFSGSLIVTQGITGSLFGTASNATSASYALTASYLSGYVSPFPYTGSAIISGSLTVTGSVQATGGFSGSFSGSGANLFNIPASGITGLNLSQIATGSVSASVSPGTASFQITSGSSTFMFVSSSGNVGFGTTTPAYKVDINGSVRINNLGGTLANSFIFGASSGLPAILYNTGGYMLRGSSDGSEVYILGANYAVLKNNTQELILQPNFTYLSANNFAIGTSTNAGYKLDVNGTARIQTSLVLNGSSALLSSTLTAYQSGANRVFSLASSTSKTDATTRILFSLNSSESSNQQALDFQFNGASSIGNRYYSLQTSESGIAYGGGFVMQKDGGWIGIGTSTNAGYTLNISGSTNITGNLTVTGSATLTGALTASNATISGNVTVLGTASINTLIVNQTQYTSGSNQLGDAADDFQTLYGTVRIPTGSLTVTGSITQNASTASFGGLVGIGTTTPSSPLQVVGSTATSGLLNVTNTFSGTYPNAVTILFPNQTISSVQSAAFYVGKALSTNNGYGFNYIHSSDGSSSNRGSIAFYGVDNILNWFATGNVTINSTTDAGYKLDVNGTARVQGNVELPSFSLILQSGVSGYAGAGNVLLGNNSNIRSMNPFNSGTVNLIKLNGSGYIEIGGGNNSGTIINPLGETVVIGNSTFVNSSMCTINSTTKGFLPPRTNLTSNISTPAQGLMTYVTASATEGLYYYNSGSTPGWRQVADTTFVSASLSGSAGYVPVFTGANSVSSSVIFQSGSNIGVGTTTPANTLDVNGTAIVRGSLTTTGVINAGGNLIGNTAVNQGINGLGAGTGEFRFTNGTGGGWFYTWYQNSNTEQMRLSTNNNLLIGTATDAGYKLDVNGAARVSNMTSQYYNAGQNGSSYQVQGNNVLDGGDGLRLNYSPAYSKISLFTNSGTKGLQVNNGSVSIGPQLTPNASSILDLTSTTQGFLPPRTNLTSNISTPAQGLMTYVTASATEGLYYYNSGSYQGWTRVLNNTGSQEITGSLGITGSINISGSLNFTGGPNSAIISTNAGNYGTARIGQIGGYDFQYGAFNSGQTVVGYHPNIGRNGVITQGGTALNIWNQSSPAQAIIFGGQNSTEVFRIASTGRVGFGTTTPLANVDIAGNFRVSSSINTAISGSVVTVIGSGSAQPIFTVQGSQGELFSITDSLSGSLFSVNDISGLPILEVFSDNTTLIGNYQDPMLITTAKVVQTNSGSFTMYSLPTASYDTAFFEYSVRSGSNARAGTIMAIQSGSSVNFTETTTTDFGNTISVSFTVIVTGSNMALTGSSTSGAWTIKTIVRGL